MMRRAAIAALLTLSAACAMRESRAAFQARQARNLEPAAIEPTPGEGGDVGVARVRVYVDEDYRAQNRRSTQEIGRLIARANRFLEPTVGLRLEVVAIVDWPRRGGEDLRALVDELASHDRGEDVELV